jgi:hypothetical protein
MEDVIMIKFFFLIQIFLHCLIFLIGDWRMSWKMNIQFAPVSNVSSATYVGIVKSRKDGSLIYHINPVQHEKIEGQEITFFHHLRKKFIYDNDKKEFFR